MNEDQLRALAQGAFILAGGGFFDEAEACLAALTGEHERYPEGLPSDVHLRWWEVYYVLEEAEATGRWQTGLVERRVSK